MMKKVDTYHISGLRQDKVNTFYPVLPAKYNEKSWTKYINQPSEDLKREERGQTG